MFYQRCHWHIEGAHTRDCGEGLGALDNDLPLVWVQYNNFQLPTMKPFSVFWK